MEEGRSAFKILTGKPTGNTPLRRPILRWQDNIRMDLKEIDVNMGKWTHATQDRDYWTALVKRIVEQGPHLHQKRRRFHTLLFPLFVTLLVSWIKLTVPRVKNFLGLPFFLSLLFSILLDV